MKERNKENPAKETSGSEETPIYLNADSTLQSNEEAAKDHNQGEERDEKIDVSQDDLHDNGGQTSEGNSQ
jgi:hypothetical protein